MANPENHCEQCKATGLPILPVRYTIVPKTVAPALPGWASGDRVTSVPAGEDFHYALRTLRTGYLYLFYEKNARGSKQWECYAVGDDGSLVRQYDPQSARPQSTPVLQCTRHGANNTQVHYLVIEKPDKCGPTWIAFSEHKWSEQTLKDYQANKKGIRNKRMQTLHPAQMAQGAKHSHGAVADKAVLEGVLEYALQDPQVQFPHDTLVGTFSQADGLASTARLSLMSTRYPWHLRHGMAESTVQHMQKRGKDQGKGAKDSTAHVLALWDAVGITHELNGYRNEAAGWVKKYGDEHDLRLRAVNLYDGLKGALSDYAAQRQKDFQDEMLEQRKSAQNLPAIQQRRANAQKLPEPERSRQLEICDIREDWARRGVPTTFGYGLQLEVRLEQANQRPEPARSREIAQIKKDADEFVARRDRNFEDNIERERAKAWEKYEGRILPARQKFAANSRRMETEIGQIVARRTQPLLKWLEAPLLIDTFNDFHGENVEDGLLFEDCVAEAIWGIGSCEAGKAKLEEWVKEAKATVDTNLVWRVMALNQDAVRSELDAALAEAQGHKDARTLASVLAWSGYTTKSAKTFADTYKKAQSIFDANARAASEAGTTVFGTRLKPVNMRGVDKFAISVGDAVFRQFRIDTLADYASEKIIQHLFSIRAMVNPADSINLIIAQAKQDGLNRAETLKRIKTARTFLAADTPQMKQAQVEDLKAAWGKFKTSDTARAPQAIKDARLALVVGLIEGVNFAKMMADCKAKGDGKSYFLLLASGMALASVSLDLASVPVKNLPGMGAESWRFQSLKLWGGVLSGAATFIGVGVDLADGIASKNKGYTLLQALFYTKATVGALAGVLTFATTFTYAAPLIGRLVGNVTTGTVVRAAGARAAALIGIRILGMALGGWITVGLLGLQVIIWMITPNALEEWIDHSAFGKNNDPKEGGYRTGDQQDKQLSEALKEMGFSQ